VLAAAASFSFDSGPAWRLSWLGAGVPPLAVALAVGLAAVPVIWLAGLTGLAVLWAKGPLAVRRFEWLADGEWRLTRPDGRCETAELTAATATLGPWILLAWTTSARRWWPLSRRYAFIGASQVSPAAFRAFRGRLSTLPARHSGRPKAVAP